MIRRSPNRTAADAGRGGVARIERTPRDTGTTELAQMPRARGSTGLADRTSAAAPSNLSTLRSLVTPGGRCGSTPAAQAFVHSRNALAPTAGVCQTPHAWVWASGPQPRDGSPPEANTTKSTQSFGSVKLVPRQLQKLRALAQSQHDAPANRGQLLLVEHIDDPRMDREEFADRIQCFSEVLPLRVAECRKHRPARPHHCPRRRQRVHEPSLVALQC